MEAMNRHLVAVSGSSYELVCVDCAEVLILGKIVHSDFKGKEAPWSFGGFDELVDGRRRRIGGIELLRLVERFILLHRCHEIRLLPEPLSIRLNSEMRQRIIRSAEELFGREMEPQPDEDEDTDRFPPGEEARILMKWSSIPPRE